MNLSIPGEKDTGGFADPTFVQVTDPGNVYQFFFA